MNSSRLKELSLKEFLLTRFRKSYIDKKDYFDRFIGVYVIFFIVSLAAQAYSGFSEMGFFHKHFIIYQFPYPHKVALFVTILYEILKALVTLKAYHEYLHKDLKHINYFFIILGIALSVGSWFFSLNGIETITKNSSPPPIDTKTSVTDSTYKANIATIDTLMARVTKRYTHLGKYYMPKKQNKYHTQKQLDNDWAMMNKLEGQKAEITANYNVQRTLNLKDFEKEKNNHEIELNQDISDNKNIVIIAEITFAICSFFNYFFAARSAIDFYKNPEKKQGNTPPDDDPKDEETIDNKEDKIDDLDNGEVIEIDGNIYRIFKNEIGENDVLQPVTTVVTELTKIEIRKCEICKNDFEVNIERDSNYEKTKKKYCSKKCGDIARIKNTYEKRRKEKEEKLQQQKQSGE